MINVESHIPFPSDKEPVYAVVTGFVLLWARPGTHLTETTTKLG